MYSSVHKKGQPGNKSGQSLRVPETSYTSIPGAAPRSPSSCNDLYATVKDFEKMPNSVSTLPAAGKPSEEPEPDYEAIQTLNREEEKSAPETNSHHGLRPKENDYESLAALRPSCASDPGVPRGSRRRSRGPSRRAASPWTPSWSLLLKIGRASCRERV